MAISVLGFGLPMLLGLMVLLDRAAARGWLQWLDLEEMSWNFANFFALPILIGAGHEYGVFMVHRYREAAARPPPRLARLGRRATGRCSCAPTSPPPASASSASSPTTAGSRASGW